MALEYCDKCGKCWQGVEGLEDKYKMCGICKNHLKKVPDEYFEDPNFKILLSKEMEKKLINDLVLTSPNFDQYYFDHKDEIKEQKDREYSSKIAYGKAIIEGRDKGNKFGIECPYCHATNIRKITVTSKAMHTALFGVFSMGRNSKQWHCDHCNSDF